MAWFRKVAQAAAPNYNDPLLDDARWLQDGEARYVSLVRNHYGSPDTIASGGTLRSQVDDPVAALFFYQKAIDTLHSIYVGGFDDHGPASWSRQPSKRDLDIVDAYLQTLGQVRSLRPAAPVGGTAVEVTHRLRTISSQFKRYGLDPKPYLDRLNTLGEVAKDVDVSGVFWS